MYFAGFEFPGSYTLLLWAGDLLMRSCIASFPGSSQLCDKKLGEEPGNEANY